MSPIMVSPLVKWTLGALGAAAVVHWIVKEVRRANAELDRADMVPVRAQSRESLPTLKRDPRTGEYRPY
jgi:hypothetical protein